MRKVLVYKGFMVLVGCGVALIAVSADAQNSATKPHVISQSGGSQASASVTFVGRGSGAVTILDEKAGNRITYGHTIKVVKSRAPKPDPVEKPLVIEAPTVAEPEAEKPVPVAVTESQPEPEPVAPQESIRDLLRQRAERLRAGESKNSEVSPPPARRTKRSARASS